MSNIARVQGIIGNVVIRDFIQTLNGHQVCCIVTRDGSIHYVDTNLIEILEVANND